MCPCSHHRRRLPHSWCRHYCRWRLCYSVNMERSPFHWGSSYSLSRDLWLAHHAPCVMSWPNLSASVPTIPNSSRTSSSQGRPLKRHRSTRRVSISNYRARSRYVYRPRVRSKHPSRNLARSSITCRISSTRSMRMELSSGRHPR